MRSTSQGIILVSNAKEKGGHQGISEANKPDEMFFSSKDETFFPRKTNPLQAQAQAQAHPLLLEIQNLNSNSQENGEQKHQKINL